MRIRLAQYGIAHAHASGKVDAMKRNPDVEFCGIFSPMPIDKDNSVYKDVHCFSSKEEMLEDDSIAGIAVEGHVHENLACAREVIDHGKHVWLDKPAGTDLNEFHKILAIAKQKGLLVQLGYMFRYNPGFKLIFDALKNGDLGDIFSIRGRMSTSIPIDRRAPLSQYKGGILFELLCHLIDIVVAVLGRPQKVTSFLRNDLGVDDEFADNTLAVLEYERAIAVVESAAMEVSPFPCRRFEIYGTRGSVILEPLEPPSIRLCLSQDSGKYTRGWQDVKIEALPRYDGELEAFVADIKKEKAPDRSLYHELIVQETVLRASRNNIGFLLSSINV